MRNSLDESVNHVGWNRVAFLVQTFSPHSRVDEALLEAVMNRYTNPKIEQVDGSKVLEIVEYELKDLRLAGAPFDDGARKRSDG